MKQKYHIKHDSSPSLLTPPAVSEQNREMKHTIRIQFDGGTPCNVPRLGYGIGYGSYQIDDQPIVRLDHKRPMSANAAEIFTLVIAIQDVINQCSREQGKSRRLINQIRLEIEGDSKIALKWARGVTDKGAPSKLAKGGSQEFLNAVQSLRAVLKGFGEVCTTWRGRAASVALFGH